jgi:hypothetical protein
MQRNSIIVIGRRVCNLDESELAKSIDLM